MPPPAPQVKNQTGCRQLNPHAELKSQSKDTLQSSGRGCLQHRVHTLNLPEHTLLMKLGSGPLAVVLISSSCCDQHSDTSSLEEGGFMSAHSPGHSHSKSPGTSASPITPTVRSRGWFQPFLNPVCLDLVSYDRSAGCPSDHLVHEYTALIWVACTSASPQAAVPHCSEQS